MIIPVVIAVAPNGARRTKADHPKLPVTPSQLAECARTCLDAGAAMIHLHVRDGSGGHTLDPGRYKDALAAVRSAVGDNLICQVTTEAVGLYAPEQQMRIVREIRPEAVSLALRELVPSGRDPKSDEQAVQRAGAFFAQLDDMGVMVQYIVYRADELARLRQLRNAGVIPHKTLSALLVLGQYGTRAGTPDDLSAYHAELAAPGAPEVWGVCAFGAGERECIAQAMGLGGHARVGFENNLVLSDGTTAPDNGALVSQVAQDAREMGRPVATAADARELFNL